MKLKLNIGLAVLAALTCWSAKSEASNLAEFYKAGVGYVGQNDVYGDNAANETRMIAVIANEETRSFQDRISERIDAALHHSSPNAQGVFAMGNGGMNAGDHGSNVGVWAQAGYSHIRDSGNVSNFKGNAFSGTFGFDYLFTPCFLGGIAFTYGHMNNAKYGIREGKYKHDSYTAALYAALLAHEFISFDAMLGYGKVHKEYDERIVGAIGADGNLIFAPGNQRAKGRAMSRRFLGGIFANARYAVEMVNLWLRFGYLHTHDKQDAYRLSNEDAVIPLNASPNDQVGYAENRASKTVNIGNLSGRLRAGLRVNEMVEPYLQGGANYNVYRTKINAQVGNAPKDRRFGWMVGGGLRLFGFADSTTGGVEYTFNKRGDLKVHNVTLDVRHDF